MARIGIVCTYLPYFSNLDNSDVKQNRFEAEGEENQARRMEPEHANCCIDHKIDTHKNDSQDGASTTRRRPQ